MRRAASLERGVAIVLLALWLVCALATASSLLRRTGLPPIFISSAKRAEEVPTVTGFRSDLLGGSHGEMQPGDEILSVGSIDLRGSNPVSFFVRFVTTARQGEPITAEYSRAGIRYTTTLLPSSMLFFAPLLAASAVFAAVAFLFATRAPGDPSARGFALWFANFAFYLAGNFFGTPTATYTSMALHMLTMTLMGPLSLFAVLGFPRDAATRASKHHWPWLFAIIGPLHSGHFGGPVPPAVGVPGAAIGVALLVATIPVIVTRNYRRAEPVARRRLRWALFGTYCAAMPPLLCALLSTALPAFVPIYYVSLTAISFLPIAMLIAVARFNLFDIDRLISATTSYNLFLIGAVVVGVAVVPQTARAAAEAFGLDLWLAQATLSFPLAAFVVLAGHRLRPRIEELFFAERHAFDQGVAELIAKLPKTEGLDDLVHLLGESLVALAYPESCVIYGKGEGAFTPLFARGRIVPPALALDGPLVATLRERDHPLALGPGSRRLRTPPDPFEQAVLETLEAEVVGPIRRGTDLVLLLCLGARRSGDVYTPTDTALLGVVAEVASAQLDRFRQAELVSRSRLSEEAMSRYVPAPIAEMVASGSEVRPAERDITVMFVDLRGYTSLCERLSPDEIYTASSRYTETISEVIGHHGGSIIEFSGDGVMAIFGAPAPLEDKEEIAVRAGREVAIALDAIGPLAPGAGAPAIGIGIASGPALCGNIHTGDRTVWTAVGNCVNLAARLQTLTRSLDALIAIDATTRSAAGFIGADFQCHRAVEIRGRSEPQDVYILPLKSRAAAA